jgi:hypothetical protein
MYEFLLVLLVQVPALDEARDEVLPITKLSGRE